MKTCKKKGNLLSLLLAAVLGVNVQSVSARTTDPVGDFNGGSLLATGQTITPAAAPGSTFERLATGLRSDGTADAAEAVTTALSPDGKTLLVLTSGHNLDFKNETTGAPITYPVLDPTTGAPSSVTTSKAEWVFVYDVSTRRLVKKQQINIPNTYDGIAWAPDSKRFYVSAGGDDRIYIYALNSNSQFAPDAPFILLGHNSNQTAPIPSYDGNILKGTPAAALVGSSAIVAGVAVSKDGKTLVAANFANDSILVADTSTRKVLNEIKFFVPGGKVATGEYPYYVAIKNTDSGAAAKAYVSSQRDDEVLAVDLATNAITRIPVGVQPNKILLSPDESRLYVANGDTDSVSVIDTSSDKVVQTISLSRSSDKYKGANPNSLSLSPKGDTLYVTLGGENALAVVRLKTGRVAGRIPTGWYPNSVSVSQDGRTLYVVNAKSNTGPNPSNEQTTDAGRARNSTYRDEYDWALEKAGIATIPVPSSSTLAALSVRVDQNDGFANRLPDPMMTFLRKKIKHVVYIVKENRTYDQVLGDLPVGNGDPQLTLFPQPITPNHHQLALNFVTLDNFYDSGESSGVGWNWSTQARTTDFTEKHQSVDYGNGGDWTTYDYEGTNRNINIGGAQTPPPPPPGSTNYPQISVRETGLIDPTGNSSILPGSKDVNGPAGDDDLRENAVGGYLWDVALRAGKTVRNYGFFLDLAYYGTSTRTADPTQADPGNQLFIPISPTPFADNIPQAPAVKPALQDKTDIYFRGFDQKNSDIYLFNEWLRDMQQNGMPALTLLRFAHDHFGSFSNAILGINTPALQIADNDYAIGKVVETISHSPAWKDTAIFIIEDDSQDGPDHVDSHRSIGYIISAYTKRGVVVSTNYNTVSMLRTMEDLLGIGYISTTDANAEPMSDVFTETPDLTPYQAIVPGSLCALPQGPSLIPACNDPSVTKTAAIPPLHNGKWWAAATKGFNFEVEDKLDVAKFNQILWAGIKGNNLPYPTARSRTDLRQNRAQLLKNWHLRASRISAATIK